MYRTFRNLHLVVGLFSALFLLAYAVSAAQMVYYPSYPSQSGQTVDVIRLPDGIDTRPRPLAQWLMDEHGLRGDLTEITNRPPDVDLVIARPGTAHRIAFRAADRTAHVTTTVSDAIGMLNRIHHIRGVQHDDWTLSAWGWLLFAQSVSLLVIAISGLVTWFQGRTERRRGMVVLAVGLAWGLTLLALIRNA